MTPSADEGPAGSFVPLSPDATGGTTLGTRVATGTLARSADALAPRGVGEILDAGIDALRERFLACLGICFVLWLPARALTPFFGQHIVAPDAGAHEIVHVIAMVLTVFVLPWLVEVVAAAVVCALVYGGPDAEPLSLRRALWRALTSAPRLFGLTVVVTISIAVGMCACFVPGILLLWKFSLATPVLVLERETVVGAIQRSWMLTAGSFWRLLAIVLMQLVLKTPFSSVTALDDPNAREPVIEALGIGEVGFDIAYVVLSSLLLAIGTALTAATLAAYYVDTRVRREGLDLRLQLDALRAEPA